MTRLTLFAASAAAAAPPYKYTTPVPPGIAAPKEVPTRFGTLKFFDGVPDQASTLELGHRESPPARLTGWTDLPGLSRDSLYRDSGSISPEG